uniref:phosphoribosylglycinamide formyltransferase n=1 Tax=Xanthomonas fragariae TaxID=48664 RepID=UPI0023ED77DA
MRAADSHLRLAVLASGRGSNLHSIVDAIASGRLQAEVVGVFSDRPRAPALQKVDQARRWSASPRNFADRAAFDAALGDAIAAVQPDWVICAGYMRILGEPLVRRFAGRI